MSALLAVRTMDLPRKLVGEERQDDMTFEDGGATISLIVRDQPLTLEELNILQCLDGVERVLPCDNTFTVIFKVDSFLDITVSTVVNAQRAIKKTLYSHKEILPNLKISEQGLLHQEEAPVHY